MSPSTRRSNEVHKCIWPRNPVSSVVVTQQEQMQQISVSSLGLEGPQLPRDTGSQGRVLGRPIPESLRLQSVFKENLHYPSSLH